MLFDRYISVEIGESGKQGVEITGLRITFKVKKSTSKSANTAEIEIYNLSDDTLNKIAKENNLVILRAGYYEEGTAEVLYSGNLTHCHTEKEGPDRITKLECLDGIKALREKIIAMTYKAGTPVMTALNDVVKELGLPMSEKVTLSDNFAHGFQFSGSAKDALTKICDRVKKEWSIQDGQMQIIDQAGTNQRRVISLSYGTGLLKLEDIRDIKDDIKPKGKARYKVTSLLMPSLKPANKVNIDTKKVKGNFRIDSLEFDGDTHGNNWFAICEVTAA